MCVGGSAVSAPAARAVTVPAASATPTVEVVDDPERFIALRQDWNDLVAASATGCLFLTWEWLWTWWRHLAGSGRLAVATVRSGGELTAMAPFALGDRRTNRLVPFRALEFLGAGSVGSDYLDIVVRRGHEVSALQVLARYLGGQPFAIELRRLRWPSSAVLAVKERLVQRGWTCTDQRDDICPFIDLTGQTWPAYLASLDGHHRSSFRRRLKALTTAYTMRLERATTEDGRRTALPILIDLHRRRWQDRGGSTAFHSPPLVAFHEDFSRVAAARGWLRLFVLWLDDAPVAAIYGLRFGDSFYFYQTGFDPHYARLGVGQVIIGLSIQSAIDEGAREYDFLHGDERYKFDWARQARDLARFEAYPRTLRGDLHRASASFSRGARMAAQQALGLLGRANGDARQNGGRA